jgi:competence protein ComEA
MVTIRALVGHIRHSARRLAVGDTVELAPRAAAALVALGVAEVVHEGAGTGSAAVDDAGGHAGAGEGSGSSPAPAAGADTDAATAVAAEAPPAEAPAAEAPPSDRDDSGRVRVNHASAAALAALPHIGPQIAQAIVAYRQQHGPFISVDGLTQVAGIGKRAVDRIRERVTCT